MTSTPLLGLRRRLAAFGLVCALVLVPLPVVATNAAAQDRTPRADLVDIEDEVMCIVCGRPLSTSGGDAAEDQRSVIQGLIDEGLTKDQVKDRLVAEYGQKVLVEGSSPIAAVAPVIAALVGGASIWLLLRRRLASVVREPGAGAADAPGGGAGPGGDAPAALPEPSSEDDARIDAELSER